MAKTTGTKTEQPTVQSMFGPLMSILGFILFFASSPVVYTAAGITGGPHGREAFLAAAAIGMAGAGLCVLTAPALSNLACERRGRATTGILYLAGMAGYLATSATTVPELTQIACGLAAGIGSLSLFAHWARMLGDGEYPRSMARVGGCCAVAAMLDSIVSAASPGSARVICALMALGTLACRAAGPHAPETASEAPSLALDSRGRLDRMLSVAAMPLIGLAVGTVFALGNAFSSKDAGLAIAPDTDVIFFALASGAVGCLGALTQSRELTPLLYRLVVPLGATCILCAVAIPTTGAIETVKASCTVTFIQLLVVLALVVAATQCRAGELPTSYIVSFMGVIYGAAFLVGLFMGINTKFTGPGGVGVTVPYQTVFSVGLASLIVCSIILSARSERLAEPAFAAFRKEQGAPRHSIAETVAGIALRSGLTAREQSVFSYLARGYAPAYIASLLAVSTSTVRTHVKHIYEKLGVNSREELLALVEASADEID